MEIYFVFFFPPQKKKEPHRTFRHICLCPTQKPTLRKAKRAFILPTHRQTVDYSNAFYIAKRDKKSIFGDSILKSMNRIKEVLEEKGIKQKWLAEKLGKSYNMVNGYVQNRQQPKLEILFEIAAILGVNPKDLIKEIK